jgi:hypothetical protein
MVAASETGRILAKANASVLGRPKSTNLISLASPCAIGGHKKPEKNEVDDKGNALPIGDPFDRIFEQQVAMRDRTGGDREIKQGEQIDEPQSGTDAGGIDDSIAQ